jgi:restriction system protein
MAQNFTQLHKIRNSTDRSRSRDKIFVSEIQHTGVGTYRILRDKDSWILKNKVEAQFAKWDEQWQRTLDKNNIVVNQNQAEILTREAQAKLKEVENILIHTLGVDDTVDWETLKDKQKFDVKNPKTLLEAKLRKISLPYQPMKKTNPAEPDASKFEPELGFMDKLIRSKALKKQHDADLLYKVALANWQNEVLKVMQHNEKLELKHQKDLDAVARQKESVKAQFKVLEKEWEVAKQQFKQDQQQQNLKIDHLKEQYFQRDTEAVLQYCELVLNNSQYPDEFPKDFELELNPDNKLMIVEYVLPGPDQFPKLSEIKYVASKKELKESFISESQAAKMYDTAIYNICLRTLHEIFEADAADAIDIVVFNGWVESIDRATGKTTNNCIVSLQATKSEFINIELSQVDPKACFKSLKGVGSSKLSGITAVQPLIHVSREDKRFVSSYDVADTLEVGSNLALMDWEDFEHLIREVFAKEFSSGGGEVKVTRASRDGGVDAIAFDPDPIRGGKIIIQAKRYTNTVGVSAVRDLYGTVMNEGATKGILVSTADYGPDAYEFVKNKPLTLLNGNNLLYLLEKHGHKARIDMAEAKRHQAGAKA